MGEQGEPGAGRLHGRLGDRRDGKGHRPGLGDGGHMTGMLAEGAAAAVIILLRVPHLLAGVLRLVTGRLSALLRSMPRAARVRSQDETEPEDGEKEQGREVACHGVWRSGRGRSKAASSLTVTHTLSSHSPSEAGEGYNRA